MPNKILIISIVILSNIIFSNSYSNEQISFDVSEIEIIDGGNKIIGKIEGSYLLIVVLQSTLMSLSLIKLKIF